MRDAHNFASDMYGSPRMHESLRAYMIHAFVAKEVLATQAIICS